MGIDECATTFTISSCFYPNALMCHSHMIAMSEIEERVFNHAIGDKDRRVQASITGLSLSI